MSFCLISTSRKKLINFFIFAFIFMTVNKRLGLFIDFRLLVVILGLSILVCSFLQGKFNTVLKKWSLYLYIFPAIAFALSFVWGTYRITEFSRSYSLEVSVNLLANLFGLFVCSIVIILYSEEITYKIITCSYFWSLLVLNIGILLQMFGYDIFWFTAYPGYIEDFLPQGCWLVRMFGNFGRCSSWVQSPQLVGLLVFPYLYMIFVFKEKHKHLKLLLLLLPLLIPYPRTFYVAIVVAVIIYLFLKYQKHFLIFGIPLAGLLIIGFSGFIRDIFTVRTLTNRYGFWLAGLQGFWEHPFFGHGPMSHRLVIGQAFGSQQIAAHSSYVGILVDFGVAGLLFWLITFFLPFWGLKRNLPKSYIIPWMVFILYNMTNHLYYSFITVVYLLLIPIGIFSYFAKNKEHRRNGRCECIVVN